MLKKFQDWLRGDCMDETALAKMLLDSIGKLIDKKLKEFKNSLIDEVTGKVASTSPLKVYLRDDTTNAVEVRNPYSLTLAVGDLVRVRFPNFKNDANRYIICKL